MMSSNRYFGELGGQRATIEITGDEEETPLSIVKPCGMRVQSNGALNMNENLHLILNYLIRNEREGFDV